MTVATVGNDWSAGLALTSDTQFDCLVGAVALTWTSGGPAGTADDAMHLDAGNRDSVIVPSGYTAYWRNAAADAPVKLSYRDA